MRIARTAVEKTGYHFDKLYDYLVPEGMELLPGIRVVVPFGRGGRRIGLVVELADAPASPGVELKVVLAPADKIPVLGPEQIELLRWLKENTFCTWFDALGVLLPAGYGVRSARGYTLRRGELRPDGLTATEEQVLELLRPRRAPVDAAEISELLGVSRSKLPLARLEELRLIEGRDMIDRRVGDAKQKMVRLLENSGALLTPKQRQAAELLETVGEASVAELCYFSGVGKSVIDKLVGSGAAEYFQQEIYRDPYKNSDRRISDEKTTLSPEQDDALKKLLERYRSGGGALLYGVTGSGKTKVYMALIDEVIAGGRRAIVLVPEIALTPQTITLFHRAYGDRVAVIHSGLSMSERLDEWKRIRGGGADVVVGTRSAVLAPVEKLGLIVIDEEQEHTYKSECSPRYDAREVAAFRCAQNGGMLLLASATPSVESYHRAVTGRLLLTELPRRYGEALLPDVCIVDMRSQDMPSDGFSQQLCEEIAENLRRREQTILLVNRRGYSTESRCMKCGEVVYCPNCSVPLRYHAANGRLVCHYCGHSQPLPKSCPSCGSEYISYPGMGTQKAEELLKQLFPSAEIARMDADSTLRRFSHQRLLDDFGAGKYDIMVGTQMVAKGLDFPNVTLVGVLTVDQMLYSDDFRSYERAFSLITQVVGRGGRSTLPGRALIQTYTPENPVIEAAATQNYKDFFRQEIQTRKTLLYPPFCRIYCIGVTGEDQKETGEFAEKVHSRLIRLLKSEHPGLPAQVLSLSEARVFRAAGRCRYKILVKSRSTPEVREMFSGLLAEMLSKAPAGVNVFIDPGYDSDL